MDPRFALDSYQFEVREGAIAQNPSEKRPQSKLLCFQGAKISHHIFREIENLLDFPCLFIRNNTRVLKARLKASRETGARIEALLFERSSDGVWKAFLKPAKRVRSDEMLNLPGGAKLHILEKNPDGVQRVRLLCDQEEGSYLDEFGEMPLPPYIKDYSGDEQRYQTVFARTPGAAAAPTAGLHFDLELIQKLRENGHQFCDITLHVGPGTFKPIDTPDIRDFEIHQEFMEVSKEVLDQYSRAKKEDRKIVCVGTTSLRAMESAYRLNGLKEPYKGFTNLYLYPGQTISACDYLLTNFHLPGSSLLVLVASLIGYQNLREIYTQALEQDYRLFSFGDSMLLPNLSKS